MEYFSVLAVLYILPLIDANCLQDPIRVEKTNLIVSIKIFMFLFPLCVGFSIMEVSLYIFCVMRRSAQKDCSGWWISPLVYYTQKKNLP